MMVVIADSSPLNYLTLIGSVDVLYRLYGTVVVPPQVIAELVDPPSPHEVRRWASSLPDPESTGMSRWSLVHSSR